MSVHMLKSKLRYFAFNKMTVVEGYKLCNTNEKYLGYVKRFHTNKLNNMTEKVKETDESFSKYNGAEKTTILNFINQSDYLKLSRFSISKGRLQTMLDRRDNEGHFKTLDEILSLKGFKMSAVEKLCDSILNCSVKKEDGAEGIKLKRNLLEPKLGEMEKNEIRSVCSLVVDLNYTSWACIENNDNRVTCLDFYRYENIEAKQLKLSNTMEIVWKICQQIPRSDLYVMEALPTVHRSSGADTNNPKSIHINLQKVQLVSMVAAALNSLENVMNAGTEVSKEGFSENFVLSPYQHKVYYLRPLLSSRVFKTYIGSERISTQSVVETIMDNNKLVNDDSKLVNHDNDLKKVMYWEVLRNMTPLQFNGDVRERYSRVKPNDKEILSQTLLLASTFVELFIFENIHIIRKLAQKR